MNEPEDDRLLRIAFEETRGGRTPPDLTARILAAAAGESYSQRAPLGAASVGTRARYGIGVAAGALATLALGWWLQRAPVTEARAALRLAVQSGRLHHASRGLDTLLVAGSQLRLQIARGDRLRGAADEPTLLDLYELGALHLAAGTLLEVKDMETTNKPGFASGTVVGALTVAVLGGSLWVMQGSQRSEAKAGDSLELRAGKTATAGISVEELARLREQGAELGKELETARAQVKLLEERLARRAAEPASRPGDLAAAAKPAEEELPKAARFGYPGLEEAMAEIDWSKSGPAIHKMASLLLEIQDRVTKGEDLPLDLLGKLQAENGILVQQAMALVKHGVPGTGVNGSYTHPVVVANQLHSALLAAKVPLDDKQMTALHRLATQYAGSDDQRRATQPESTTSLRSVLDEMALKERFYDEARNLLTQDQRDLFFKPGSNDTLRGSMFSTGLMIAQWVKPTSASDVGDYGQQVAHDVAGKLGLEGADKEQLTALTQRWASRLPKELVEPSPHDASNMVPFAALTKSRAILYAQQQAALFDEMLQQVTLSPEQREKLRKELTLRVPLIRAKKK